MKKQAESNVKAPAFHHYMEGRLVTGRVGGKWRRFRRMDGGTQYVFCVQNTDLADVRKYGSYTRVELYVGPEGDQDAAERLLNDGFQVYQIDCVLRRDTYQKYGEKTTRTFLFADGLESVRPAALSRAV